MLPDRGQTALCPWRCWEANRKFLWGSCWISASVRSVTIVTLILPFLSQKQSSPEEDAWNIFPDGCVQFVIPAQMCVHHLATGFDGGAWNKQHNILLIIVSRKFYFPVNILTDWWLRSVSWMTGLWSAARLARRNCLRLPHLLHSPTANALRNLMITIVNQHTKILFTNEIQTRLL